jgi:Uma2 family endonuclease
MVENVPGMERGVKRGLPPARMLQSILVRPEIHRALTAEEFFWLADPEAKELVDGEIVTMTPAFFRHGMIASRFDRALRDFAERTGAGEVVTAEAGFITRRNPDRVRAPDVAFVTAARLATHGTDDRFFEGAPDLAIEVLSPGDRAPEVQSKIGEYLGAGARLVWVADPESATVTVYRLAGPPSVLGERDVLEGDDLLPGFRLELARLFAR